MKSYAKLIDNLTIISASKADCFLEIHSSKRDKYKYTVVRSRIPHIAIMIAFVVLLYKTTKNDKIYFQDLIMMLPFSLISKFVGRICLGGLHREFDIKSNVVMKIIIFVYKRIRVLTHMQKDRLIGLGMSGCKIFECPTAIMLLDNIDKNVNSKNIPFLHSIKKIKCFYLGRLAASKNIIELLGILSNKEKFELHIVAPHASMESTFDYTSFITLVSNKNIIWHKNGLYGCELVRFIKNMDVMFTLSESEGFGKVYIESIFYCTPVVCLTNDGVKSIKENLKSIHLVESIEEFSDYIQILDNELPILKELANKDSSLIPDIYGSNQLINKFVNFINNE